MQKEKAKAQGFLLKDSKLGEERQAGIELLVEITLVN